MKILLSHPEGRQGAGRHCADFITPGRWTWTPSTPIWAADNGCFNRAAFKPDEFRRFLDAAAAAPARPLFVTMPDYVGDHDRTAAEAWTWSHEFSSRGIPAAFVMQDGIGSDPLYQLPWGTFDTLFIGGTTEFKLSATVAQAVTTAAAAGIHVHMGRVNSVKRLAYAREIGCHSVDGSGIARFPPVLERMIKYLDQPAEQLTLWGNAA